MTYPRPARSALSVRPQLLAQAPELAALGLLEVALEISVRALVAEHPTLDEFGESGAEPASLRRARRLVAGMHPLKRAIHRYRAAVLAAARAESGEDDDDLSF